jgi:hypothetical protein
VAIRSSSLASVLVVAVAVACTSPHHNTVCPKNQPAFRIQLTASDGPLPADTELIVTYSGTEMESYSLAHGGADNQDVCCRPGSPTSGALPDVPCGIPPVVSMEASVKAPVRDAGSIHDAAVTPTPRADASAIADAALMSDASSPSVASLDASFSADASSPMRDASVEDSGAARHEAGAPHAAGPAAILCDLWTNGVATVKVTATGYAKMNALLDDPFVPDPRCGVETVDHRLILTHGDGGLVR